MQQENFYQKNPVANKILKIFYESFRIYNFTIFCTNNR
jgi:hypothetical protein